MYYEDYKEEFEDEDDAWDDFEDNEEYWDEYWWEDICLRDLSFGLWRREHAGAAVWPASIMLNAGRNLWGIRNNGRMVSEYDEPIEIMFVSILADA